MNLDSWHRCWHELGARQDLAGWHARLIAAYSEPHRHYHTMQHLRECLEHLANWRNAHAWTREHALVELALWFHDAVYVIGAPDNEERSADWAAGAVRDAGLDDALARRVHALVMDTRHQAQPQGEAAELLVDIDLAILGAHEARFDEYEQQIAREYASVPEAVRRPRRAAILRGFLARPRLYATEHFASRLEAQARANLARSIATLES